MSTGVETYHPDYTKWVRIWDKIDNAVDGDLIPYLRQVGDNEGDPKRGALRQKEYEDGAILTNFTSTTAKGLRGMIFMKPPTIDLPDSIEYMLKDVDGAGVGIQQQAQLAVDEVGTKGRFGILVNFPVAEDGKTFTQEDVKSGKAVARLLPYKAQDIVDWRVRRVGAQQALCMVYLRESVDVASDESSDTLRNTIVKQYQYRELYLDVDDGRAYSRVYNEDAKGTWSKGAGIPIKQNGVHIDYLPFYFSGADNNDHTVDPAPFRSLADLQVGHFRNSADHEESVYVACQAMLVVAPSASMSAEKWDEANPNGVRIGARSGLNVGDGGNAFFIQAKDTNGASTSMEQKEEQARRIGAQIIVSTANVTAESARIQQGTNASGAANVATNVSMMYQDAIVCAMKFNGQQEQEFDFLLNTDFFAEKLTAQEMQVWQAGIQAGIYPRTLFYMVLRKSGTFPPDWTDEMIEKALDEDKSKYDEGLV